MSSIAASQVKALRDKTGVSMGDCKKALVEANGDEAQAIEILNRKYAGQLGKRADKEAANERIGAYADGKYGALVELRCETDFVANNEDFMATANKIAEIMAKTGVTDVDALLNQSADGSTTVKDLIARAYGKLQENMSLARAARLERGVAYYVHHNGLRGVVLAADKSGGDVAKDICMHITAMIG